MKKVLIFFIMLIICSFVVMADNSTNETDSNDDVNDDVVDESGTIDNSTASDDDGSDGNETDSNVDDENETDSSDDGTADDNEDETDDSDDNSSDEEVVDEETEEEIELMHESGVGAKLRILQLRRAITSSFIIGSTVIGYLDEKGEDVSELTSILDEIEIVKDEANSLDPNSSTAVEDFVYLKKEIKDLNKEFKGIAAGIITLEDRKNLDSLVKIALKNDAELEEIRAEIIETRNSVNAFRIKKKLTAMNVQNKRIVEWAKNGNYTKKEVAEKLRNAWNNLEPGKKLVVAKKIKDEAAKEIKLKKEIVNKIKNEFDEEQKERLRERIENIPASKKVALKRINDRIDKLEQAKKNIVLKSQVQKKQAGASE